MQNIKYDVHIAFIYIKEFLYINYCDYNGQEKKY